MSTHKYPLRSLSWLLRALAFFVSLTAFHGLANAAQPAAARNSIVSLWIDKQTGTLLKATPKTLYRSNDEGRTWGRVMLPTAAVKGNIAAVTVATGDKKTMYVAGSRFGVLRSSDGGQSWKAVNKGLPSRKVVALTTHSTQPDTVYAYVSGKGNFRSQDAGVQWRLMDRGPRDRIAGFVHSNMPGSMESGWLFAATPNGVSRSMDCFCGWHKAGELAGGSRAVSYDPDQPQRVYAAGKDGLFVSVDGGEHWAGVKSPISAITALAAGPGGALYAAGDGQLFRSRDRGVTWESLDA